MELNPMEMKAMIMRNSINDVNSNDKSKRIKGIEFLEKTIGVGDDMGLATEAINALKLASQDKNRRVRKAAEKALEMINKRRPPNIFDMFQGGVGFSSKK